MVEAARKLGWGVREKDVLVVGQKAVSKAELARHIEAERTAVSRLLGEDGDPNPTIQTIIRFLWGLGLRAEINVFDREPGQNRLIKVNDERTSATSS